jgi:hypothetical protein
MLLLAVLVTASEAQARSDFVLVPGGPRLERRIGPFHFLRDQGRYPAAVRAFGNPSLRTAGTGRQDNICIVRWGRVGLQMQFSTGHADPCADSALARGTWVGARVDAGHWRTDNGLGLGDSLEKLRRLYPQATYRPGPPQAWQLLFVRGEVGTTVLLQAQVRGRRITSFELPPPNVSVRH